MSIKADSKSFEIESKKLDKMIKALNLIPDMEKILRDRIDRYAHSVGHAFDRNMIDKQNSFEKKYAKELKSESPGAPI